LEQFLLCAVGVTQAPHHAAHVTQFRCEGDLYALKGKSRTPFQTAPLSGDQSSIPEYEQRALAERTKTARLRELRLAREAELASRPEEKNVVRGKLTQIKSSKTSRGRRAFAYAPYPEDWRVNALPNSIRTG
jgi:hypothetical protein